ncbi:MAG: hypothetical protein LBS28_00365 [Streptococcaceae bacterium]|jgi:hypothetical protein|nr:hypothetical protein [Streptococcaceae bacterium]
MKVIKKFFVCLCFLFLCINSNTLLVSAGFISVTDLRFVKNPIVQDLLKSKISFEENDFTSLWEIANPGISREGLVVDSTHMLYTVCLNYKKEVDEIFICVPIIDTTTHKVVCEASLSAQPNHCSLYLIDVAQLLVFGGVNVNNFLIFSEKVDTQYFLHEPSESLSFIEDLNMLNQVVSEQESNILILLLKGQDVGKGVYTSNKLSIMNVINRDCQCEVA